MAPAAWLRGVVCCFVGEQGRAPQRNAAEPAAATSTSQPLEASTETPPACADRPLTKPRGSLAIEASSSVHTSAATTADQWQQLGSRPKPIFSARRWSALTPDEAARLPCATESAPIPATAYNSVYSHASSHNSLASNAFPSGPAADPERHPHSGQFQTLPTLEEPTPFTLGLAPSAGMATRVQGPRAPISAPGSWARLAAQGNAAGPTPAAGERGSDGAGLTPALVAPGKATGLAVIVNGPASEAADEADAGECSSELLAALVSSAHPAPPGPEQPPSQPRTHTGHGAATAAHMTLPTTATATASWHRQAMPSGSAGLFGQAVLSGSAARPRHVSGPVHASAPNALPLSSTAGSGTMMFAAPAPTYASGGPGRRRHPGRSTSHAAFLGRRPGPGAWLGFVSGGSHGPAIGFDPAGAGGGDGAGVNAGVGGGAESLDAPASLRRSSTACFSADARGGHMNSRSLPPPSPLTSPSGSLTPGAGARLAANLSNLRAAAQSPVTPTATAPMPAFFTTASRLIQLAGELDPAHWHQVGSSPSPSPSAPTSAPSRHPTALAPWARNPGPAPTNPAPPEPSTISFLPSLGPRSWDPGAAAGPSALVTSRGRISEGTSSLRQITGVSNGIGPGADAGGGAGEGPGSYPGRLIGGLSRQASVPQYSSMHLMSGTLPSHASYTGSAQPFPHSGTLSTRSTRSTRASCTGGVQPFPESGTLSTRSTRSTRASCTGSVHHMSGASNASGASFGNAGAGAGARGVGGSSSGRVSGTGLGGALAGGLASRRASGAGPGLGAGGINVLASYVAQAAAAAGAGAIPDAGPVRANPFMASQLIWGGGGSVPGLPGQPRVHRRPGRATTEGLLLPARSPGVGPGPVGHGAAARAGAAVPAAGGVGRAGYEGAGYAYAPGTFSGGGSAFAMAAAWSQGALGPYAGPQSALGPNASPAIGSGHATAGGAMAGASAGSHPAAMGAGSRAGASAGAYPAAGSRSSKSVPLRPQSAGASASAGADAPALGPLSPPPSLDPSSPHGPSLMWVGASSPPASSVSERQQAMDRSHARSHGPWGLASPGMQGPGSPRAQLVSQTGPPPASPGHPGHPGIWSVSGQRAGAGAGAGTHAPGASGARHPSVSTSLPVSSTVHRWAALLASSNASRQERQ